MSSPLLIERSRGILRVTGREPVKMVQGLATADIDAVTADQSVYTAFLTPKGRMVADARVFRWPSDGEPALLLDVDPGAREPLQAHLAHFVPPLFARAEDVSDDWAVAGVYGPGAADAARAAIAALEAPDARDTGSDGAAGGDREAGEREEDGQGEADTGLAEGIVRVLPSVDGFATRTGLAGDDGWDFFVPADRRDRVMEALEGAGARPGSPEALDALRIAAGRPRWGRELTDDVIPIEAGLLDRAISQSKGCYTGQEVIVRILHRGHVNRHLRRLEFAGDPPEPGTELFEPDGDRPRGVVTSVAANDAGAIGLGYVRREIEPPAELRAGSPDGDPVLVTPLE